MATTNYSLPTILGTNAFDLVTDYNALANATDAALAQVAGTIPTETITEMKGQISALQTLTGSHTTQITTLQSQMSTANGNISALESGLDTANSNIGTLQTGLQGANTNISTINQNALPYMLANNMRANPQVTTLSNLTGSYVAARSGTYIEATLVVNKLTHHANLCISKTSDRIGADSGHNTGCYVADLTSYADYLPSRNISSVLMSNVLSVSSNQYMFLFAVLDVSNKALNIIWQTPGVGYSASNLETIIGGNLSWYYDVQGIS